MLGKLIKNEWKSTYKIGCLMLIVLVGVTFLGWLAFQSPMWQELFNDTYYRDTFGVNILNIVSVCTLLLYAVMLVAVSVGIIAYLGVRFYRTMYTDEGYLTHTLPVTEGQILFTKTLISGIWILIISLGIILSVFGLCVFMISAMLPEGYSLSDFWWEIQRVYEELEMEEMLIMFERELGISFRGYFIYMIVSLILGAFTSVMTLFGAISMGQLFTKHRVLMAIASYIAVSMLKGIFGSVIEGIVTQIFVNSRMDSPAIVGSYINTNMIIGFVLSVVFAVLLYLASWLVNTRKLNME